jgi:ceramide glucosyltransferase
MRSKNRTIRLAGPFPQLIGPRTAGQMWKRQVRWARLRRATFPLLFMPEVLAGPLPPVAALLLAASAMNLDVTGAALAYLSIWYGAELLLAHASLWPRRLWPMLLRDLLLPAIFIAGCAGNSFEWHGQRLGSRPATLFRIPAWARRMLVK